jgi:hypothetical protein
MTGPLIPDGVTRLADTVLHEGLMLYPYRASSQKNQVRWQFGVLMAPDVAAADPSERASAWTELIVECPPGAEAAAQLRVVGRFLQVCRRAVEEPAGEAGFREVASLDVAGTLLTSWDEVIEREVELSGTLDAVLAGGQVSDFRVEASETVEAADPAHPADSGGPGAQVRVRRYTRALRARLELRADRLETPYGVVRLHARIDNLTPGGADRIDRIDRGDALRSALVAAHLLVSLHGARAVSSQDPPEWARALVDGCTNGGLWPVLAGPDDGPDVVLAAPIILDDHPRLAPESPTDLFDATEIDEILTLRTLALSDGEKREVRATDPRAAALLDSVETLPGDLLERLHGAVRSLRPLPTDPRTGPDTPFEAPVTPWWDPEADTSVSPEDDRLVVGGIPVGRGSRVRLRPGARRADAQDLFLVGRTALVQAVLFDVDGAAYLAVTPEDDPAADLNARHGRFLYFAPDEVEPLEVTA